MINEHPIGYDPKGWPPHHEPTRPVTDPHLRWNPYAEDPYHPDPYAP